MTVRRSVALRLLVGVLILGTAYHLHQHDIFRRSIDWVERMGPWGPLLFIGLCIAASIVFVPSVAVTFAVGASVARGPVSGGQLCVWADADFGQKLLS